MRQTSLLRAHVQEPWRIWGFLQRRKWTGGAIWCSITGYGRNLHPNRVGFGDDAAAAGCLLAQVDKSLWFVGDASADPLTGATAAALTHGLWFAGSSGLIDISLAATSHMHTHGVIPKGIMW